MFCFILCNFYSNPVSVPPDARAAVVEQSLPWMTVTVTVSISVMRDRHKQKLLWAPAALTAGSDHPWHLSLSGGRFMTHFHFHRWEQPLNATALFFIILISSPCAVRVSRAGGERAAELRQDYLQYAPGAVLSSLWYGQVRAHPPNCDNALRTARERWNSSVTEQRRCSSPASEARAVHAALLTEPLAKPSPGCNQRQWIP